MRKTQARSAYHATGRPAALHRGTPTHCCPASDRPAREGASWPPGTYLQRLHVQYFGDATLHDQKVWIVDVELHRVEQVLHARIVCRRAVDQVLVAPADDDDARDGDLVVLVVAKGTLLLVRVVEGDAHGRLCDTCLTALINEILEVGGSNLHGGKTICKA